MYFISQMVTTELLKCPLQRPGTSDDKTETNRSILVHIELFQAIGALPTNIDFGSNESAPSSSVHSVSWHKSFHLKYNNFKLRKIRKEFCTWMSLKEDQVSSWQ